MLDHWFKPLGAEFDEFIQMLNPAQAGRQIETFTTEFPSLENCQVVLMGTGPFAQEIRRTFYQMEFPFTLKMVDLGNVASINAAGLLPVLQELAEGQIIPIILGGDQALVQTLVQAKSSNQTKCHPLFIDEKIAYGKVLQRSYINNLMEDLGDKIQALTVLGYQKHLSTLDPFHKEYDHPFHALRLSQVKTDQKGMEPYIRDCNSISFSLNALKKAEAPNKAGFNPSGLESESACLICRYAGLNEQMNGFLIHGMDMDTSECGQTATLVAQMIWYFLDGIQNRMSEFPIVPQHLTEYMVTSTQWEEPLHFFKSLVTGRWWMAHPLHVGDYDKMIPCTYDEYLSACRDEVPERIISLLS